MTEALAFAALSMLVVAAAWGGLKIHRRRMDAPHPAPDTTYPDRLVAAYWRIDVEDWVTLPESVREHHRAEVIHAPGFPRA